MDTILYIWFFLVGALVGLALWCVVDDRRRRGAVLDRIRDRRKVVRIEDVIPTRYVRGKIVSRRPGVPHNPPGDEGS